MCKQKFCTISKQSFLKTLKHFKFHVDSLHLKRTLTQKNVLGKNH